MVKNSLDNGLITKEMDMVNVFLLMETDLLDNGKMTKDME